MAGQGGACGASILDEVLAMLDLALHPDSSISWQRRGLLAALLALAALAAPATGEEIPFPTWGWPVKSPAELGLDEAKLAEARDYAFNGGGSGYITRCGYLVIQWGDARKRFDLKS